MDSLFSRNNYLGFSLFLPHWRCQFSFYVFESGLPAVAVIVDQRLSTGSDTPLQSQLTTTQTTRKKCQEEAISKTS